MVPACSGQREHSELRGEDNDIAENLHFHNTLRRFPKKIVPLLRSFGIMPLTLIDEVFYWTVSCLLTKCTWEIDQHMLKNNPEGKYLFGLFFAIFSLGPKQMIEKSHFLEFNLEEPCRNLNCQVQFCPLKTDSHCL